MKFSPIQGDFSAGELSQRLWGHTDSDAYKAGLALASNFLATQQGSVASRRGAKLLSDGHLVPSLANAAAVHLPVMDGPAGYGAFQIECRKGSSDVRFMDKYGAIPVQWNQDLKPFFEANKDGNDVWTDPVEGKLYIRNYDAAVGTPNRSINLTCDTAALIANVGGRTCQLAFYYAGVGLILEQWNGGAFVQAFAVTPGYNTFSFQPLLGTTIKFSTTLGYGLAAIDIWGMRLAGDFLGGVKYTLNVFGLTTVGPGLRHTSFWSITNDSHTTTSATTGGATLYTGKIKVQPVFCVVIVGPGIKPVMLKWTGDAAIGGWSSHSSETDLFYEGVWDDPVNDGKFVYSPPWLTYGAVTSVIAYQGRLWFGLNDAYGSLHATKIGYGTLSAGTSFTRLTFTPGFTSNRTAATAGHNTASFTGYTVAADTLKVFKNGLQLVLTTDYTATLNADQVNDPGGKITAVVVFSTNDEIVITHYSAPPGADNSLDLKVAQPTGQITWLTELRGLLLGTARDERVFSSGTLAIDPVSGSAFDVEKHTSYGSDPALPALAMHDKVVFALPGRQRIRLMGRTFNTFGGLLASDLSLVGEHLLEARIRAMCYLRAPVPRLVFAFDDGTGAVATFNDDKNTLSWARLSVAAPYDIYSVAALESAYGSELWITSSNGASFVITNLDSKPQRKLRKVVPVVATNRADQIVEYAAEQTPPVMDGWAFVPAHASATYTGLPLAWVGLSVGVTFNGNLLDPVTYPVTTDGAGGGQITLAAAIPPTCTDSAGKLQAAFLTVGLLYPDHRFKLLPLEGGNPVGTSQGHMSRGVQRYLRLVDSYLPKVNGARLAERDGAGLTDVLPARVTGDRRITDESWKRASQPEISMEFPLRVEVSAIFGGTVVNSV